ncbi:hypothetical protein MBH78_22720 [Oceanimonas sp. NS1]|nr:hypothetical protein [Oceanimonas sp. NS1]
MIRKSTLPLLVAITGMPALAADWSTTELHYQLGELKQQPLAPRPTASRPPASTPCNMPVAGNMATTSFRGLLRLEGRSAPS